MEFADCSSKSCQLNQIEFNMVKGGSHCSNCLSDLMKKKELLKRSLNGLRIKVRVEQNKFCIKNAQRHRQPSSR
jgi:hypothetical protein